MLRDAGVRTKLLAVLAIPTLMLVLTTGLLVAGQVSEARRAEQVVALTDVAIQVNRVVHSLQDERSTTLVHLEAPSSASETRMRSQRGNTNQQINRLRDLVADSSLAESSSAVASALARSEAAHGELPAVRGSIDEEQFFATEADVFYGKVIRADLDLPGVVAASGTADLARALQAYQALSATVEYAAHERDLVQVALVAGSMNEVEYAQAVALVAQQRQSLQDFQAKADGELYAHLDSGLADADNVGIDQVRRNLPDLLTGSAPDADRAAEWVKSADSRISVMTRSESLLVSEIAESAATTQLAQERRALVLVTVALLGLGLAAGLAIALARRITRPLHRLTVAATDIGDELPRMVERMQTPGDRPGVVVEPIVVESRDEIGRLAEAFNTVNEVSVQVAEEQAALRASIAEMFVNVARRNQVLLSRQLKALDAMEAGEEDPDVLQELFTLDHLATRMRRNAESLLVLAGIDSTRRLRAPVPLSDVIRTAVGEIEAYDRIDLSMTEDPDVSGRHALTVAHLLAELLENATHFSNPETRVVVTASSISTGRVVTITDQGLGMSEEEIAEANQKISDPPLAEIAVSQRLGLFVVGRLAARLGAAVELRPGRAGGTNVSVALPAAVFEDVAVTEPAAVSEVTVDPYVDEPASPVTEAVSEPVDELAEPAAETPPPTERQAAPRRRWWRRRTAEVPASEPDQSGVGELEPEPQPEPETEPPTQPATQPPTRRVTGAHRAPEPQPAPVVEPEPVPVVGLEPVPVVGPKSPPQPAPEPVATAAPMPEPVPQLAPEAEPHTEPAFMLAPAIDILPSRGGTGRFGRRAHQPPRKPAPPPVKTTRTDDTEAVAAVTAPAAA
ncbi:MAG: nitrate- and nitrite sensing domain-containing protein, partial [Sporichthyaceae bacterium]|nr:nitrate- and nitrite sensing domain-containing protein [Sporichthyaceae bacterium]